MDEKEYKENPVIQFEEELQRSKTKVKNKHKIYDISSNIIY